jgi:hypothetical protein
MRVLNWLQLFREHSRAIPGSESEMELPLYEATMCLAMAEYPDAL